MALPQGAPLPGHAGAARGKRRTCSFRFPALPSPVGTCSLLASAALALLSLCGLSVKSRLPGGAVRGSGPRVHLCRAGSPSGLPIVGFGALGLSDTLLLLRPGPRGPAFGALVPSRLGASERAPPLFTASRAHHEPAGQAAPTATISRDSLGKRSKRGLAPEEIGNWWG